MKKATLRTRALPIGVAAIAFATFSTTTAQESSARQAVKVEAGKVVTVKRGHSRTGVQTEAVELSKNVSFADLDLTTPSGAAELRNRIHDTADSICKLLRDVGPPTSEANERQVRQACVEGAARTAMGQMRRMMASAEEAKRRG